MASVILLRGMPAEHVVLTGDRVQSRRSVLRRLNLPELIAATVREQTRDVRLPIDVILFARLIRALEVLP